MRLNLFSRAKRLRDARGGAAAVEFAFIAPMVVLVFFGLIELAEGTNCRQRMESVASTTADLVAQASTITDAGRNNIFAAASAIMYPYPNIAKIKFSSLVDDGTNTNKGKVVWSEATSNTTARATNEVINNLPVGLITSGGSVIMVEVSYTYASPIGKLLSNPVTMNTTFYSRPRRSVTVTRTS
jgi:Flp pilus assembly protein TadG